MAKKRMIIRPLSERTAERYSEKQLNLKRRVNMQRWEIVSREIQMLNTRLSILQDKLYRLPNNPRSNALREEVTRLLNNTSEELRELKERKKVAAQNIGVTEQEWLERVYPRAVRI